MNNRISLKNYRITEYCVLVCILLFKIWCGFANQALLFAAGAAVSGAIDFGICAYLYINARRNSRDRRKNTETFNLLIIFWAFSIIYMLIMALGRDSLPQMTFLGMIPMPKQIGNALFMLIYLTGLILSVRNLAEDERRLVSNFTIAVLFVVALANLITVIINPELAKNEAYNEGTSLFTLGYSGSYPLVIIVPVLLYKLGTTKHKVTFGIIFACNLASVFLGGYFIAILGAIVALLVYWILSIKNKIVVIVLGLFIVVSPLVLLFSGALEDAMLYLADNIPIDVISTRCTDIAEYLSGNTDVGKDDTTFRIFIYKDTFNNFLKHPILGNYIFGNYDCQWDHATILDLLSIGGVWLCGLFFVFIAYGYKFACSFIRDERAKRALLAAIVAYLFIATVNSVLSYKTLGVLFVVAPIIMGGERKNENFDTPSL